MSDLFWEDVSDGDTIPALSMNLTVHRLVVFAGGNRDFAAIHHNENVAHHSGAPHVFANNVFCQGMWERTVRDWMGLGGRIKRLGPFRLKSFSSAGDTVVTTGRVIRTWTEGDEALVELELETRNAGGTTIGPGPVVVSLPRRDDPPIDSGKA